MLYHSLAVGAQARVRRAGADPREEADQQAELLDDGRAADAVIAGGGLQELHAEDAASGGCVAHHLGASSCQSGDWAWWVVEGVKKRQTYQPVENAAEAGEAVFVYPKCQGQADYLVADKEQVAGIRVSTSEEQPLYEEKVLQLLYANKGSDVHLLDGDSRIIEILGVILQTWREVTDECCQSSFDVPAYLRSAFRA